MGRYSVISAPTPESDAVIPAGQIRAAVKDYRTAEYWRRSAEQCRLSWEAGKAREIDYVRQRADAGDRRFRGRTERDLAAIATVRWSQSTQAQRMRRRQERYAQRALVNLAFARFRLRVQSWSAAGVRTD